MKTKQTKTKKPAPKSEFFDLDLVLENATLLQDGYFQSSTFLRQGDKTLLEVVYSENGVTTFSCSTNGKAAKSHKHENGKWS